MKAHGIINNTFLLVQSYFIAGTVLKSSAHDAKLGSLCPRFMAHKFTPAEFHTAVSRDTFCVPVLHCTELGRHTMELSLQHIPASCPWYMPRMGPNVYIYDEK